MCTAKQLTKLPLYEYNYLVILLLIFYHSLLHFVTKERPFTFNYKDCLVPCLISLSNKQ